MTRTKDSVTLADVAREAGVSIATASKALNGKVEVKAATRRHVEDVARGMAFKPNPFARALNSSITGTIGVLAADLSNRFVMPVLRGVEDAFGAGSTSVILTDARKDSIRERHQLEMLVAKRVDGIIMLGHSDDVRPSISSLVPVPVVYAYAPSDLATDASFTPDIDRGARMAVDHLVSRGRRRIALVSGDPSYCAAVQRASAATAAMATHGLEFVAGSNLFGEWSEEWGRQCIQALLSGGHQFDGVFCANDQIARGVSDELRDNNISVPRDVAVVGYDNWELFSLHSRPPTTTVDMQLEELGRAAARELASAIAGDSHTGVHHTPVRLIPRASSAGL